LGRYEVTQGEWEEVMGTNPSHFSRTGIAKEMVKEISDSDLKRFPADSVSWDAAQDFIRRLNEKAKIPGWEYRLPKEAEWEYACRGALPLDKPPDSEYGYDFYLDKPSNTLLPNQANFNHVLKRTCKVGSYKPNRLGLYDMHGNVHEWCDDRRPAVLGEKGGELWRMGRGGCFLWSDDACHANTTFGHDPTARVANVGLRVARVRVVSES